MHALLTKISKLETQLREYRHHLHRYPEIAFQEHSTAKFIHQRLLESGFPKADIKTGIAGTGLVANLNATNAGSDCQTIALRADMDALAIEEQTGLDWQSQNPGLMHACGHDGHMAMLLGAAQYLIEHQSDLQHNIRFIFQPAEENEAGAEAMLQAGLFDEFPCDSIYGLHSFPGFDEGSFLIQEGAVMASYDNFDITVSGQGGHAAMPHQAIDPVPIAAQIITALQSLVSRANPLASRVLSITRLDAGSAYNIIPDTVLMRGTVRTLDKIEQDRLETSISRMAQAISEANGARAEVIYKRCYPITINAAEPTRYARERTRAIFGETAVSLEAPPSMGSEDFAFFARKIPGCYARLGAGGGSAMCGLHNSGFDFNDSLLVRGTAWWCGLALKPEQLDSH